MLSRYLADACWAASKIPLTFRAASAMEPASSSASFFPAIADGMLHSLSAAVPVLRPAGPRSPANRPGKAPADPVVSYSVSFPSLVFNPMGIVLLIFF